MSSIFTQSNPHFGFVSQLCSLALPRLAGWQVGWLVGWLQCSALHSATPAARACLLACLLLCVGFQIRRVLRTAVSEYSYHAQANPEDGDVRAENQIGRGLAQARSASRLCTRLPVNSDTNRFRAEPYVPDQGHAFPTIAVTLERLCQVASSASAMPNYGQELYACLDDGIIKFPAFVHLPSSSRHQEARIVPDNESVKLVTLRARMWPSRSGITTTPALPTCWKQIAARCDIHEDKITGLTVPLSGQRVLIEQDVDWNDWVATFFFEPTPPPEPPIAYTYSMAPRPEESRNRTEFTIKSIHIKVLVEPPEPTSPVASAATMPQPAELAATSAATSSATPSRPLPPDTSDTTSFDQRLEKVQRGLERVIAILNNLNAQNDAQPCPAVNTAPQQHQQMQQSQQSQQLQQPQQATTQAQSSNFTAQQSPRQSNQVASQARPAPAGSTSGAAIANNVAGIIIQALQPQLREVQPLVSSLLSTLPAQLAAAASATNAARPPSAPTATVPTANTATGSTVPSPPTSTQTSGAPAASARSEAVEQARETSTGTSSSSQQRQSLMESMFDELSRLHSQQQPSTSDQVERTHSTSEADGPLDTELTQAFAQMIAEQRSTSTPQGAQEVEDEDESLTIVSTASTSSRRSSRSRSGSPRSAGNRTIFTTTTLFLTLFTFILSFITPTLATPALQPSPLTLNPRPPVPEYHALVSRASNSRNLHLCKCTCFQTNSTLVPLYSTSDPSKPCSTCNRQFCLDQGLEICKGAKLPHTDHDTGTGLEGDVWAKCFERDSGKDQSIITLYLLVVVGLVAFAAFRGRVEGWVRRYEELGPRGLYSAVRDAPWRRGR